MESYRSEVLFYILRSGDGWKRAVQLGAYTPRQLERIVRRDALAHGTTSVHLRDTHLLTVRVGRGK